MGSSNMTVKELIEELSGMPEDAEIGFDVCEKQVDLLVGEDPQKGESITILQADWN